jgi:hypothetical protein
MGTRTQHLPAWPDHGPEQEHIRPGQAARAGIRRAAGGAHHAPGFVPRGPDHGTLRLTARGTALAVFSICFPGTLTSGWLHVPVLSGASFVAACLLAALATRREDLLVVVTLPPVMFLFSAICVAAVSANGGGFLAAASGVALTLGAAVAWLLIGEAALLVLSLFRGLPGCVRDLRADLRGEP